MGKKMPVLLNCRVVIDKEGAPSSLHLPGGHIQSTVQYPHR